MRKVFIVDSSAVIRSIEKKILLLTSNLEVVGDFSDIKDIVKSPYKSVDFIFIEASGKNTLDIEKLLLQKKKIATTIILLADQKIDLIQSYYNGLHIWQRPDLLSCSSEKLAQIAKIVEKNLEEIKTSSFLSRKNSRDKKESLQSKSLNNKKIDDANNVLKKKNYKIVLVGVSTGGPGTILKLLGSIGKNYPLPILITQHIDSSFEKNLTEWLQKSLPMPVHIAEDGVIPKSGNVYFAPADFHMIVSKNSNHDVVIKLTKEPPINFLRPAVDKLFLSGAEVYKSNVISVLLTGMGSDGAKGSYALREKGAYTIAESEESCVVYGMPKAACDIGGIVESLPLNKIADRLKKLV